MRTDLRHHLRRATVVRFYHDRVSYYTDKTPITKMLWETRLRQRPLADEGTMTSTSGIRPAEASLQRITYDFSSDASLRHLYTDSKSHVLVGKLLEDLDALAGNVAFLHCHQDPLSTPLLSLVTATVEKIRVLRAIPASQDLVMEGKVIWVGKSSLDILIELLAADRSCSYLSSIFTYVARDRATNKAVEVNRLLVSQQEDHALFEERERAAKQRKRPKEPLADICKERVQRSLDTGNALLDMPALGQPSHVLMRLTSLENSFICQPQNSNTAGRVFGGFLSKNRRDSHRRSDNRVLSA